MPYLEINEGALQILMMSIIVINKTLPNISFTQLLDILPESFMF